MHVPKKTSSVAKLHIWMMFQYDTQKMWRCVFGAEGACIIDICVKADQMRFWTWNSDSFHSNLERDDVLEITLNFVDLGQILLLSDLHCKNQRRYNRERTGRSRRVASLPSCRYPTTRPPTASTDEGCGDSAGRHLPPNLACHKHMDSSQWSVRPRLCQIWETSKHI